MRTLRPDPGHSLNYGDLIDHGQHILAPHGLLLAADPAVESATLDHDTPLIDGGQR